MIIPFFRRLMSEEEGSDDSVKDASISRSSTEGSTTSSRKSSLSTTKESQSKVEKLLDKGEKQIISTTLKKSCNWLREGMNVFVQKELGVLRYIGEFFHRLARFESVRFPRSAHFK